VKQAQIVGGLGNDFEESLKSVMDDFGRCVFFHAQMISHGDLGGLGLTVSSLRQLDVLPRGPVFILPLHLAAMSFTTRCAHWASVFVERKTSLNV